MPEANAAPNGQEAQAGTSMTSRLLQMVAMYVGMQLLVKQFVPKQTATDAAGNSVAPASGGAGRAGAGAGTIPAYEARPLTLDEGASYSAVPQNVAPIWPGQPLVDVVVTVSSSARPRRLGAADSDPVVMAETGFGIGNNSDRRAVDTVIAVPAEVQKNGTLWAHFFVGRTGAVLDPYSSAYDIGQAYHFAFPLTQYIARKKERKTRNLLEGGGGGDEGDDSKAEAAAAEAVPETGGPLVRSYYHPNTSLSFVPDTGVLAYEQLQPPVRAFVQLEASGAREGSGQHGWYYPVLFVNTFWQLKSQMTVLNETVTRLPLHLDLGNLANWKFQIMAGIEANSRETARQAAFGQTAPGGGDGSEMDMIKEILLDTHPLLLGVTALVTVAHLLLEMLAFGSDIAHYRKKKDNVGISVRSILANVFMQTVIFLYLVDNSQNTSWMILGSQGVGILIELWKITTVVDVRVREAPAGALVPWRIAFEDKHRLSETEAKTQEYDEIAFRYMYMAGVPLLLAYAAYSLVYESHRSWYSFVITTLVGSVYAYGFLMMVPSLYINYRLKSVAHMPGKAMMYKFVNTFIDDLFAFTIKMPFLHRLATFRDDIIFFIYLYQRYKYRVDYSRVNEFGQGGDEEEVNGEAKEVKDEAKEVKGEAKEVKDEAKKAVEASGSDAGKKATKRK